MASFQPPRAKVERVALRWREEVAESLGVGRTWLYESGLAAELRFVRRGKVRARRARLVPPSVPLGREKCPISREL